LAPERLAPIAAPARPSPRDVLTTFRGSPNQIPFGICAVLLGAGSWILSPMLARRRAGKMAAHAPLYRWIARKLLLRVFFMEEWRDLLLALGGPIERNRFLYRGGRSFGALVLSFLPLAFLASLLEKPGIRAGGRAIFEGSVMVLWGAIYFGGRAFLEALNRVAAIRQGEGRDPRWGGDGGD